MGNDFFDEIGQVNPWQAPDPAAGPQEDQERDFFKALEALKAQRNAAATQMPQAEEAPPQDLSPPDAPAAPPQRRPENVSQLEGAAKAIPGTGVMMGSSAVKGAGISAADKIDPWLEKLARVSPMAKDFVYFTGLGDQTLDARQTARLAYTMGEADTPESEPRDTSLVYQIGDWAEKGGYSLFGIDPAVQQKAAYKAVSAAAQAVGMGAEWLAVSAVAGPLAGTAAVSAHGALMELGSTYDNARMMGATHEEAIGHAERKAVAVAALEAVSIAPVASALGRTARGAQAAAGSSGGALGRVGQASFTDPVAQALEKSLRRRGISVRQKGVGRAITATSAGLAEGAEEYLTGVYGDLDMKYLGERWAPRKSWLDILAGPERAEEFLLGFIGGGTVGTIVGGRMQFTEDRKNAAKAHVVEIAKRRGEDPGITDESIERTFRRAEDKVSTYVGQDMATIGKAIESLRAEAADSKNIETDLELTLVADGLGELYEAAGVRAGRRRGMDPDDARDLVRNLKVNELGSAPEHFELEDARVAQELQTKVAKFGTAALDAIRTAYITIAPRLTGVKKRTAEAVNRVVQKVDKAQKLYDETTQSEETEKAEDQQRAQMFQAATADQLRRGAEARLDSLRKKWGNPEARRRAIQILLADGSMDVNEADPSQGIPGSLYTSAMLDMAIGVGANPEMTVREAMVQELQFLAEAQEIEFQEQLADINDKQEKMALQAQKNEMKKQQQAFKDMFQQMKMQEQLRQWNQKVEQTRLKEMTDEERLVETRRKLEQDKFNQEQKQQEKERQEALREPAHRMTISAREKQALVDAFQGENFDQNDVRMEGNELLVSDPEFLDLIAERLDEYNEEQRQEEALDKQADRMRQEAKKGRKKVAAKKKRETKKRAASKPSRRAADRAPKKVAVPKAALKKTATLNQTRAVEFLQAVNNKAPKRLRPVIGAILAIYAQNPQLLPKVIIERSTDGTVLNPEGQVVSGYYSPGLHTLVLASFGKEDASSVEFSTFNLDIQTAVHEFVHALTSRALDWNTRTKEGKRLYDIGGDLQDILDYVRSYLGEEWVKHYGAQDIHELLAEALTNPVFQKELKKIPPSDKYKGRGPGNLWDQIVDSIRKFLGVNKDEVTVLDEILTLTEETVTLHAKVVKKAREEAPPTPHNFHRIMNVPPPKSQHKGAWAPAMMNGEKVEVQQGPLILNKKTGLYDKRWVTIRRRNSDGTFKKGVERKKVLVTTLGKWLAQSNGSPSTTLHAAFGIPAPATPAGPSQPSPPAPPPLNFNTKDPDQKRPGWQAWASHLMRWGSQIELAYGKIGALLNRWGHDAGQTASSFKGTFRYNLDLAEEWAKKAFPTKYKKGMFGRVSGPFKMYFGLLLSGKSIADELAKVGTDKWGKINETFLRTARAALGFDPADLYQNMNEAEAKAAIKEAETKARAAKVEEERKMWERRADYIKTALNYHADAAAQGELRIMHSVDSIADPNLRFLIPALMAARASHDMAYKWRENYGLNNTDLVPHTQNHVYEGLSSDFFKEIKKNGEVFEAELESAVTELWAKVSADTKLFTALGLNPNATVEDLKTQMVAEARASLAQNTSSVFAQHSPKFGSFIKERRGLYGVVAADWSIDGSLNYLDKAGRDIAYNRMARDFWLTKKDDLGNPVHPDSPNWIIAPETWFYHGHEVKYKKNKDMYGEEHYEVVNKNIDDTFSQILINAGQANAFKDRQLYGPQMVGNFILHTRGRELKDGPARAASAVAKFQYVTKLGNLFTVATNMSVLFTLGAVLQPTNMLRTMYGAATNWKDYKARAVKSGAVDPSSDPMSEFFSAATKGQDSSLVRGLKMLEGGLIYAFSTSESVIRTLSAHAAEAFYNANVEVLQDPSKAGIMKKLGVSSVTEAKSNLKDILGLSEAEINALEKGTATPAQVEQITLKAMYRGSNEINFRHGGQYVPQMFSRNNALSIFTRVFKSFAYNVFAFQAKLFGKPLKEGVINKDPELVKTAFLRAAKVYGGAFLTAQILKEMAKGFKDDDDEDNLKGESQAARFAYNRLNDLNTVGMFGLLSDPLSLADPVSMALGVNWRSAQNVIDYGQEGLMMPAEDIFKGRMNEAFDQFMHANFKVLQKEITHVRMLTDAHKKYFKDRKDYANARQVSRALYLNNMTTLEKIRYKKQRFQPSFYAKERDAVVNALAEGRYGDAMTARREFIQRIMQREDASLQDALKRARAAVMMKAPLSEWSRTVNPEKSSEQLMKFLTVTKDVKDRRDKAEAKRFAAAHLHYVRAVNALFPSVGK